MHIVGCDFHPGWQQVAILDTETGEIQEHKLENRSGEAEGFYKRLSAPALIGFKASGNSQWFEDLLQDLGHEVWVGDAAQIRASCVRKQKTDRRDAARILKLLLENRFPFVAARCTTARPATAVDSSSQASGDSGAGKERLASPDAEPRHAVETQTVEPGRPACLARVAAGRLGGTASQGLVAVAGQPGRTDQDAR